MNHLSFSKMQAAKTCMKKYFWRYIAGIEREEVGTALNIGKAIHRGIASLLAGKSEDEIITIALEELPIEEELNRAIVVTLLLGYIWRWKNVDADIKILEIEKAFVMPIINPETGYPSRTFEMWGVIDAVIELPDGRKAIMEHKTCSEEIAEPDAMYWKRLRLDAQMSIYFEAEKVDTIIYNVIRKPTIRLKQTESVQEFQLRLFADIQNRPDFYFQRHEIPRLDSDLADNQFDVWQTTDILRACEARQLFPRNTGACCVFGTCAYFDLCCAGYKPEEPLPEGYILKGDKNDETAIAKV